VALHAVDSCQMVILFYPLGGHTFLSLFVIVDTFLNVLTIIMVCYLLYYFEEFSTYM
jgi:asparagine N-glycosylation enzyme membrane subunit Stt3